MKKILLIAIIIVIAATATMSIMLYRAMHTQGNLHFDNTEVPRAFFPVHKGMIEMFDSTLFLIDTGSSYSTINTTTLNRIKRMGLPVERISSPIFGRGNDNRLRWFPFHYRLTLPIAEYRLGVDTVSNSIRWLPSGRIINHIKEVNFIVTDDDHINTLGMDILENFILEHQFFRNALALRTRVEENYQELADMTYPRSWDNLFGSAHRYYVQASVDNGAPQSFLIDTGVNRLSMKLPYEDSIKSKHPLNKDIYITGSGINEVRRVDNAWVRIGKRAGSHPIYYAPFSGEGHSINPLLYFRQDAVFDFANKKVYLRPYAMLGNHRIKNDSVPGDTTSLLYFKYIRNPEDSMPITASRSRKVRSYTK